MHIISENYVTKRNPQGYVTKVITIWHDNLFGKSSSKRLMRSLQYTKSKTVGTFGNIMNKPHEL